MALQNQSVGNFRRRSYQGVNLANPEFSNADLRGVNFSKAVLEGANFSGAKLQGANFKEAVLIGANFQGVKTGVLPQYAALTALVASILGLLVGLMSGYVGGSFGDLLLPLKDESIVYLLSSWLALIVLGAFIVTIVRSGWGTALIIFALVLAIAVILLVIFSRVKSSEGTETFETVLDLLSVVIFQILLAIFILTSLALGSVTVAIASLIGRLSIALASLGGIVGIFWGIQEGLLNTPRKSLIAPQATAILLSVILILTIFYIGLSALKEDRRYALVRQLAISIVTSMGTSFRSAQLLDANFIDADLRQANFEQADLTRACWFGANNLDKAMVVGTYLERPQIRAIATTGNGRKVNLDGCNLQGINLQSADLKSASFINANLSEANLRHANLSGAKLVRTQLYRASLSYSTLTSACIQDWGVSSETTFDEIKCDYVYMRLATEDDPDVCRKPDNRQENFREGDFSDFIAPLVKALDLYRYQYVDPREIGKSFKTLDLYHHEGIDPNAAAIAFTQLAQQYPEAGLKILALEGPKENKLNIKTRVESGIDRDILTREYSSVYQKLKGSSAVDLESLLVGMQVKQQEVETLKELLTISMRSSGFVFNMQDQRSISIDVEGNTGDISGLTAGDVKGVQNLGAIRGNLTETINQIAESSAQKAELKELFMQLKDMIASEDGLSDVDKNRALHQLQVLAVLGTGFLKNDQIKQQAQLAIDHLSELLASGSISSNHSQIFESRLSEVLERLNLSD